VAKSALKPDVWWIQNTLTEQQAEKSRQRIQAHFCETPAEKKPGGSNACLAHSLIQLCRKNGRLK
jgi:hypothetical protein